MHVPNATDQMLTDAYNYLTVLNYGRLARDLTGLMATWATAERLLTVFESMTLHTGQIGKHGRH